MGMWDDVCTFHRHFQIPQTDVPGFLSDELMEYRIKFLYEELTEFREAYSEKDDVKAWDALMDLVYVALGTAYMMRLPWDDGWYHVQYANMRKVRAKHADESKRNMAVDVIKPKGWVSPEMRLHAILLEKKHIAMLNNFDHENSLRDVAKHREKRANEMNIKFKRDDDCEETENE